MNVEGSVALVTGGASGLGAGAARGLVDAGGRVVIADLASSAGESVAAELGDGAAFVAVDVTHPDDVEAAVAAAAEVWGRIDVLVSCAGISSGRRMLTRSGELHTLEHFRAHVEVNLIGLFDVLRHTVGHMAANEPNADGERGVIVNLGSIAGLEGQVGQMSYSASKGGIIGMTLPLARDLGSRGIRVMAICPGIMDTPYPGLAERRADRRHLCRQRLPQASRRTRRRGRPGVSHHGEHLPQWRGHPAGRRHAPEHLLSPARVCGGPGVYGGPVGAAGGRRRIVWRNRSGAAPRRPLPRCLTDPGT